MQLIWLAVVLNLTLAPLAAEAQQAVQAARIGYLAANLTVSPHMTEAFRQGLRDLGYVDTGWERTPWHATQRAAWEALKQVETNELRAGTIPSAREVREVRDKEE